MAHPAGELAVAAGAKEAGIPYVLSTVGSTSIEDVAASGHPDPWFQLYVWRDRETVEQLIERARASGYRVLELSIDVPVAGHRTRDTRNGLTIPPRLSGRSLATIAAHPGYWLRMIRVPAIRFASAPAVLTAGGESIADISAQFDPSLSWPAVSWVREMWPGTLVVKGPVGPAAAERLIAAGVDGLHLSNHGGRQLDRSQAPIKSVAMVRAAIGDGPLIVVDSGIRHGADLVVAIALGADAGAIGRAYLYGLMVAGQAGVEHALSLLADQFIRTLRLLGVTSMKELRLAGPEIVQEIGRDHASIGSGRYATPSTEHRGGN
jgi:L-lactate dehydrogenase (cytochrome)